MTPEKAIELLSLLNYKTIRLLSHDEMDALRFGVEAIKRLLFMRSYNINQAIMPLPGERKGD